MSWQTFAHSPSGKTETWLRFHGGSDGDWTRPDGSRVKSIQQAEKMGWMRTGPFYVPGMSDEDEAENILILG